MEIRDIILASSSPRRREIFEKLGIRFRVVTPDADENICGAASAEDYVIQAAQRKCRAALLLLQAEGSLSEKTLAVACDTVVVYDGMIIGKPPDTAHAVLTLGMLSDSWHAVYSGLAVYWDGRMCDTFARTDVKFRRIPEEEILSYVDSGEPMGKAGSYAIQQKGSSFVERIEGEYENVVGLPIAALFALLEREFGILPSDLIHY